MYCYYLIMGQKQHFIWHILHVRRHILKVETYFCGFATYLTFVRLSPL